LSIESSPGSEKGSSGQQMTPELLNEAFSAKVTLQKTGKHHKEPYEILFST
jgi:hypothetical protein